MNMNLDASSLNIYCPEHNQYVQYVCLVNQCYQKLMCENCLKKHRDVHKNMHIPLMELINNFKKFTKTKLEEGDDLSSLHEQVRTGIRNLRGPDSKPSDIDYMLMQCLDGKDQETKYNMFNEKSQLIKNSLATKEVKLFTDELNFCLQAQQKKILNFEKTITESMQNQLRRATSRKLLEEKFLKDSCIQVILDDLKNNNDRYNQLNKNLQKMHKGFLELKISKKIFRDMCTDTQQRFKIFTKNISSYFEQEYQKLFSFMIDTNEALNEQAAYEKQYNDEQLHTPSLQSPAKSNMSGLSPDLSKKLKIPDKKDPNFQMHKMIDELKKINLDIRKNSQLNDKYGSDTQTQTKNHFSFTPDRIKTDPIQPENFSSFNNSQFKSHQQSQSGFKNQSQSVATTPSKKKIQLTQITSYQQPSENIPKEQQDELLQRVNFQKKIIKMDFEKMESVRFNIIQSQIQDLQKPNNKSINETTISLKSLQFLYSVPNMSMLDKQQKQIAQQQANSISQSVSPVKKNTHFRIHTTTNASQFSGQPRPSVQQKFIDPDKSEEAQYSLEKRLSKQLERENQRMRRQSTQIERSESFNVPKEQMMQLSSINQSSICYEMSAKSDYKSSNIVLLSTNPFLRTYGYLEQLNLPFKNFSHPQKSNTTINPNKKLTKRESQENLIEQTPKQQLAEITKNENSFLINYQKDQQQQVIIGIEELSNSKFLSLQQNGIVSVWQIQMFHTTVNATKVKEYYVCKNIYCYSEVNQNEDISSKTHSQQQGGEYDPILMIGGQNELNESTLNILRYESKKGKFSEIDSFRSYHGSGAISQMQVICDKQFKKKNVPNSLQLITDTFYVFTLNLFDYDEEVEKGESRFPTIPSILVQKIAFHRDKHGSTEKTLITKIKIKNNLIIQRILYDSDNDCLWGHSDYILFKWRINFMSKCLESQECITLCTTPNDIITSMYCNNSIMMISSLQGNIWGVDVMFNKVIQTDFQRIKYSSINHYNKIQGKDPIYIISGSKVYLTPNHTRTANPAENKQQTFNFDDFTKTSTSLSSTHSLNVTQTNITSKNKETQNQQQLSCESYFLYSTLSSSGVKVFCFDSDFKQLLCTLSGQENHLQQIITLHKDNLVLAVEDFNTIRLWKNDQI